MHGNVSIYNKCIRKMHPFLIPRPRLELFKNNPFFLIWYDFGIQQRQMPEKISINSLRKNIIVEIAIPSSYLPLANVSQILFTQSWSTILYTSLRSLQIFQILNIVYVDITHNISSLHVKVILKLEKIFYKNFLCMAWRKNIYISLEKARLQLRTISNLLNICMWLSFIYIYLSRNI